MPNSVINDLSSVGELSGGLLEVTGDVTNLADAKVVLFDPHYGQRVAGVLPQNTRYEAFLRDHPGVQKALRAYNNRERDAGVRELIEHIESDVRGVVGVHCKLPIAAANPNRGLADVSPDSPAIVFGFPGQAVEELSEAHGVVSSVSARIAQGVPQGAVAMQLHSMRPRNLDPNLAKSVKNTLASLREVARNTDDPKIIARTILAGISMADAIWSDAMERGSRRPGVCGFGKISDDDADICDPALTDDIHAALDEADYQPAHGNPFGIKTGELLTYPCAGFNTILRVRGIPVVMLDISKTHLLDTTHGETDNGPVDSAKISRLAKALIPVL
ncbi:MAG: hypothetical protein UY05_C0011G0005 [Candidatus Peregrinibacteria bacterium GW2011_GWA2_47_7]|nr:MAG: hypothetical protein UY05_C0011G0005 [Candidatus Peregrinibacteria bacterium GW2011_GWA2_47_7]